ncbi:MAG: N-6 DNA methylase [Candidatus Omnitrophota bacterium]
MLTQETKRHIDAARQVLVGVVPNPTSQIDQITNALIYKFMDDMDQLAIRAGGEPSFFIGELERYSWTKLMDSRMGNQERMNLYSEALVKFSEAKQLPQLFREIFKSAFLPYRSPEVLGLFLKEIDYFDYSHSEELGNAYEYLLSIMSSQGDAGQFRTPRHIIDFIVKAVDPTKDDKVLDPACGTAGFLVSAYKHILEQHDGVDEQGKKNNEKPLTPDERRALMNNFEGYDVDPGMVRISQVNMYLHHFKNPKIFNYNTLSQEERWGDKFNVILANPPFMSPKGGVSTHKKFSVPSNRSEVLFVDYIMNHLRPRGRAGIIVPEGIIFQSATAYKKLRENLVNDGLYAVVSLPSGVFQPYSGVKTSILLFDNELASRNTEMLFVKVENDGFDLGASKRAIKRNDLPKALDIVNAWKTGRKIESKLALYVEKAKIVESGDHTLSGDRYRIVTDYSNAKWPMVDLGEVCEILDSKRKPITKADRVSGEYPYYGATGILDYVKDYIFDEKLVLIGEDGAKWGVGDKTAFIAKGKYWVNNHAHVLKPDRKKILDELLVELINSMDLMPYITGVTVPKLNQEKLRSIKIPLLPLEVQEQIVFELNSYQNIISGARQVADNWKPKIEDEAQWKKVSLGDIVEITTGKLNANAASDDGQYPFFTCAKKPYRISSYSFDCEALLLAGNNASADYDVKYYKGKFDAYQRTYVITIKDSSVVEYEFLRVVLEQKLPEFKSKSIGNLTKYLTLGVIKQMEIFLPSTQIQKQIVKKVETERVLVESSKKLINIYEQKTKDVLSKLWSE